MSEPDRAPEGTARGGPGLAYHLANVALLAFVLLLFSVGLYSRNENGWKGPRYDISAEQVRVGVPEPWLYLTSLNAKGEPQDVSRLPEGALYREPLAVDLLAFFVSVNCLTAAAAVLYLLARWLGRSRLFSFSVRAGLRFGVLAAAWVAFGAITPGPPDWAIILILLALLALTVALTWADHSLGALLAAGSLVAPCLFWGSSMADPLRSPHLVHEFRIGEFAYQMPLMLAVCVLLTLAAAGAAHLGASIIGRLRRGGSDGLPEEST